MSQRPRAPRGAGNISPPGPCARDGVPVGASHPSVVGSPGVFGSGSRSSCSCRWSLPRSPVLPCVRSWPRACRLCRRRKAFSLPLPLRRWCSAAPSLPSRRRSIWSGAEHKALHRRLLCSYRGSTADPSSPPILLSTQQVCIEPRHWTGPESKQIDTHAPADTKRQQN